MADTNPALAKLHDKRTRTLRGVLFFVAVFALSFVVFYTIVPMDVSSAG